MTTTNSAILFNAFLAGPEALGAVEDAVLADQTALEDLHTAVSGVAANLILQTPDGDSALDDVQDGLQFLRTAIRNRQPDPDRVRLALRDFQSGIGRWSEDQRYHALTRTRRVMLFDNPPAMRQAVRETLGVGDETKPSLRILTEREYEDFIKRLIENKKNNIVPFSEPFMLYNSLFDELDEEGPEEALQLLIEGASRNALGYLHYLSLLVTHSPELFDERFIRYMEEKASSENRLHALVQQLRANR